MAVLFSHFFNYNITKYLFIGNAGVNLFFVISGFLITEILLTYKDSSNSLVDNLKKFYLRRFFRIFPIYYLYLVFIGIFCFSIVKDVLPWAFLYCINFYQYTGDEPILVSHLWTLSIEEQFYIFWPILILALPRKRIFILIIGVVFFAIISRFLIEGINHKSFLPSCLDAFGLGALFAYLKKYHTTKLKVILGYNAVWVVSLLYYISMILLNIWNVTILDTSFRLSISIISFYLIGISLFSKGNFKFANFLLENKLAIYIGKISYGIYLYHLLIAYFLDPFINAYLLNKFGSETSVLKYIYFNSYLIKLPLYTIITIAVAAISFKYIERPIALYKNRIS
jgi:peptidoglycan/LPS O-acetylase OafA/YrhL